MRVFILKFFDEGKIEERVSRLVAREKKRAGISLRVACVDEQIQKRLETAGITSEILHEFQHHSGINDELSWQKTYEISDELRSSNETNNSLKFHGVNFLDLEHDIGIYIFVTKVSTLCTELTKQGCDVLILVLTDPYATWVPDIDTPAIETLRFGKTTGSPALVWIRHSIVRVCRLALNALVTRVRSPLRKKTPDVHVTETGELNQAESRALFIVSTTLYARPALAICNECDRNGLVPYVAPYAPDVAPIFQGRHHIEYSNRLNIGSAVSFVVSVGSVLLLLYRLRKHLSSLCDSAGRDGEKARSSAEYFCYKVLLDELPYLCLTTAYQIIFLENLIKSISPEIICLMPDGYSLQQMAAATAKKHNIPTLACSAALENGNARSYMRHLHADKIAAMGEVIKNIYIESGVKPERIAVTGVAHFDRLFNRDQEQDKRALLAQGIDPGKRIIVFGTENLSASETVEALTGVIKAVLKAEDIHLVVKVHPTEDIRPYLTAAEEYHDPRIHVVRDIELHALLSLCELVIVKFSTVALEAMMIDKPVVVINLPGQPTPVPYAEEGAALGVYKFEDIEPAILKVLYNEETRIRLKAGRDKFVRAWAGEPDGKASLRIVNLMKEMIEANKIGKGYHASQIR